MIIQFTDYCRRIGLLDLEENFTGESDEIGELLFLHLLTQSRASLIRLSNRIADLWQQNYKPPMKKLSSKIENASLYEKSLQREEVKLIKQQNHMAEQLKECTFQPQVRSNIEFSSPVHERLTKYGSDTKLRQQANKEIKVVKEMQSCTFRPQVNEGTSKGNPFDRLYQNALTVRATRPVPQEEVYSHQPQLISQQLVGHSSVPVQERLYYHHLDKQEYLLHRQQDQLVEQLKECTFTPQINSSESSNQKVFDRLYNHTHTKSTIIETKTSPQIHPKSEQIIMNSNSKDGYVSQFQIEQSPFDRLYKEHKRIERRKQSKSRQ